MSRTTQGHGWWPYFLPYVSFMLLAELGGRLPESAAPVLLLAKTGVPAAALAWFYFVRGAYPELRQYRADAWALADIGVGLALAVAWVAPFVFFAGLRPTEVSGFDPWMLGDDFTVETLALRMLGYGFVTPLFEELFVRSWAMRYAEVAGERGDFRQVPIGHYSAVGFGTAFVLLMITHVPFEWVVMAPWAIVSTLWLYYRKDLMAVVVLHGATNVSILIFVAFASGRLRDPATGFPLDLWYLV